MKKFLYALLAMLLFCSCDLSELLGGLLDADKDGDDNYYEEYVEPYINVSMNEIVLPPEEMRFAVTVVSNVTVELSVLVDWIRLETLDQRYNDENFYEYEFFVDRNYEVNDRLGLIRFFSNEGPYFVEQVLEVTQEGYKLFEVYPDYISRDWGNSTFEVTVYSNLYHYIHWKPDWIVEISRNEWNEYSTTYVFEIQANEETGWRKDVIEFRNSIDESVCVSIEQEGAPGM